jgi:hypothetical protein
VTQALDLKNLSISVAKHGNRPRKRLDISTHFGGKPVENRWRSELSD